jgi:hypothetical protein
MTAGCSNHETAMFLRSFSQNLSPQEAHFDFRFWIFDFRFPISDFEAAFAALAEGAAACAERPFDVLGPDQVFVGIVLAALVVRRAADSPRRSIRSPPADF